MNCAWLRPAVASWLQCRTASHDIRRLLGGIALFVLGGCTIIKVENGSVTEREWLPGIAIVSINSENDGSKAAIGAPEHNPMVVEHEGFGLIADARSVAVGWAKKRSVIFPDPSVCQVVFVIENVEALRAAEQEIERLGGASSVCIDTPFGHR